MPAPDLRDALHRTFGHTDFRPGQVDAIRAVLDGRDSLVVMPTGAGKSLCYQLPAVLGDGTTLVISPLIALMKDQVDALVAQEIAATYINSSLDASEQSARLAALAAGSWRLCYIAPERLRHAAFRAAARRAGVRLLAVDEAHCISQWGHDFRPDYLGIGDFATELGRPPLIALTATATPQVQEDIETQLLLRSPSRLVTGFNRPNLRLGVSFAAGETDKQKALKRILDEQPAGACGLVYVGRRREAQEVAAMIRQLCGRRALMYHAGMPGWERDTVQDAWMSGEAEIVVATNAFGMGVDKSNVRFVIHYTMPGTLEAYYQEAGRAGRDDAPSHCVILYDPADSRLHEWFIENDAPSLEELRQLYRHLRDEGRASGGRVLSSTSQLATLMEWRMESKVRMGLTLLEEAKLLENQGEIGGLTAWQLLPTRGRVDMLAPLRSVEARRAQKRRLLWAMVDYAQSYDCRRQYLLDYFGDATPPVAEWCCDNCQRAESRSVATLGVAATAEEKATLAVLDAVHHLGYGVGRALLARILVGSRAAGMDRYFSHPQYGLLRGIGNSAVRRLIDELLRERYLKLDSGPYPTLSLTEAGQQAVAQRLALPVTVVESEGLPSRPHAVPERVTDTVGATLTLHEQGLSVAQIADTRNLAVGTIYNHLAELIAQGRLEIGRVVSDEVRAQVVAAVDEVGSYFLSPIKGRLPESISYGEVRCVVAWLRREGYEPPTHPAQAEHDALYQRLVAWRDGEARRVNEPAYSILSNTILQSVAAAMPGSLEELRAAPYLSDAQCERFGPALLEVIAESRAQQANESTVQDAPARQRESHP